jgi:hypothetical protein
LLIGVVGRHVFNPACKGAKQAKPVPRSTAAEPVAACRALLGRPRLNVEEFHLMGGRARENITNAAIGGMIITSIS